MNSPISLICSQFSIPIEIENIIQSYTINEIAYVALRKYFDYLHYEQEIYDDFAYSMYIVPNCYCHHRRKKDCSYCYYYDYTMRYKLDSYKTCILYNKQLPKIYETEIKI